MTKKKKEKDKIKFKGEAIPKSLRKKIALDPVKALARGLPNKVRLVTEGRTGHFREEFEKEETKFLGKFDL